MKTHEYPARCAWCILLLVVATLALNGCSRDPNVVKQRYLESGKRDMAEGKYNAAIIHFENALRLDPRFSEAHYQLAQVFIHERAWQPAIQALMRATQVKPGNLQAQLQLANLLVRGRAPKPAQERVSLVLDKDPNNIEAHLLQANIYALTGDIHQAIDEAGLAVRLDPKHVDSYIVLGQLQSGAGNTRKAEEAYAQAIALDPQNLAALLHLADLYSANGRAADAEVQYKKAIAAQPSSVLARTSLARYYVLSGKMDTAEQVLRDASQTLHDDPDGYRLLADFYTITGQFPKALTELSALMKAHPKDDDLKKSYVEDLIYTNQLDAAGKVNQEILERNPRDLPCTLFSGEILNRKGQYRDAIPVLEKVVKLDAENGVAHYELGIAYRGVGDANRAETEWREVIRLRPRMVEAQRALAAVAIDKGDWELLEESANQLVSLQPANPMGYVLRARAYFARKQGARGEADIRKAIQIAPNSPVPYTRLAQWRAANGKSAEAEQLFEHSLALDPGFYEALQGLTTLYMQKRQLQTAINRVQAQITRVPGQSSYYNLLARLQLTSGDAAAAETSLNKAIQINKNDIESLILLGQLESSVSKLDVARQSYERSIAVNPRDVRAYVLLGTLDEKINNWEKAQELYKRALAIEPDYPPAANNLAFLLMEHGGNLDLAASLAQVARQRMPDSPAVADTLGWAYYRKGAYSLAIDLLQEAVNKSPQSPMYHYHLGLAYDKISDSEKAKSQLNRALQLDPNFKASEIKQFLENTGKKG